jgi:hypothetical protein
MALVGFLTSAYNTGSVLGFETLPKAWLPPIGIAVSFLTGMVGSIVGAPSVTTATILVAIGAGFVALGGNAAGSAIHWQTALHRRAPGTSAGKGGGGGGDGEAEKKPDAVEVEAAKAAPVAQKVSVLTGWVVGTILMVFSAGCTQLPPPVPPPPATQITAIDNAVTCVESKWGESLPQLAADCLQSSETATNDIVADIEAIVEIVQELTGGQTAVANAQKVFPYASNATVVQLVVTRKAARASVVTPPLAAPPPPAAPALSGGKK